MVKILKIFEFPPKPDSGFGGKFKFKIATKKSHTSNAIISTTITIQNLL